MAAVGGVGTPFYLSRRHKQNSENKKAFHWDQCEQRRGETGLFLFLTRSLYLFLLLLFKGAPQPPPVTNGVLEKWPFGVWHQHSHGRAFESSGWGRQALDRSQRRGGSSGGLQAKRTPINQSVWAVLTIHLSPNVPEERETEREIERGRPERNREVFEWAT